MDVLIGNQYSLGYGYGSGSDSISGSILNGKSIFVLIKLWVYYIG